MSKFFLFLDKILGIYFLDLDSNPLCEKYTIQT